MVRIHERHPSLSPEVVRGKSNTNLPDSKVNRGDTGRSTTFLDSHLNSRDKAVHLGTGEDHLRESTIDMDSLSLTLRDQTPLSSLNTGGTLPLLPSSLPLSCPATPETENRWTEESFLLNSKDRRIGMGTM